MRGLVATGGVITSAGIVLAATFGVMWSMPLTGMVGLGVVVSLVFCSTHSSHGRYWCQR